MNTLAVGEIYRGLFGGDPAWLRITKILIDQKGDITIKFKAHDRRLPRWLWLFAPTFTDSGLSFLRRIQGFQSAPVQEPKIIRSVRKVDVRYR